MTGLRFGVDPREISYDVASKCAYEVMDRPEYSEQAFHVEEDRDGQLHISPRFRRLAGVPGQRCPATYAQVATAEGRRSALLTFMQTAGSVAIRDIFPEQFSIAKDDVAV